MLNTLLDCIKVHLQRHFIQKYDKVSNLGGRFCTLRDSEALRSSLMTADKASGLMPCSHNLTHMDRDSMSNPVFSNLEISSKTVGGRTYQFVLVRLFF